MKKLLPVLALLGAVVLASCDDDSYYHNFNVVSPSNNVGLVYADQTKDTVWLQTTDKFTVNSQNSWMKIVGNPSENVEYVYGGIYQLPVAMTIEPNTTGANRVNYLSFATSGADDWSKTSDVQYTQLSWLNITNVTTKYISDGSSSYAGVEFSKIDSTNTSDVLKFTVYGDWTLTDGSFIHPEKLSGNSGSNSVNLTVDTNETFDTLTTTITLTSNGVSTPVTYKQLPKKVEKTE